MLELGLAVLPIPIPEYSCYKELENVTLHYWLGKDRELYAGVKYHDTPIFSAIFVAGTYAIALQEGSEDIPLIIDDIMGSVLSELNHLGTVSLYNRIVLGAFIVDIDEFIAIRKRIEVLRGF